MSKNGVKNQRYCFRYSFMYIPPASLMLSKSIYLDIEVHFKRWIKIERRMSFRISKGYIPSPTVIHLLCIFILRKILACLVPCIFNSRIVFRSIDMLRVELYSFVVKTLQLVLKFEQTSQSSSSCPNLRSYYLK